MNNHKFHSLPSLLSQYDLAYRILLSTPPNQPKGEFTQGKLDALTHLLTLLGQSDVLIFIRTQADSDHAHNKIVTTLEQPAFPDDNRLRYKTNPNISPSPESPLSPAQLSELANQAAQTTTNDHDAGYTFILQTYLKSAGHDSNITSARNTQVHQQIQSSRTFRYQEKTLRGLHQLLDTAEAFATELATNPPSASCPPHFIFTNILLIEHILDSSRGLVPSEDRPNLNQRLNQLRQTIATLKSTQDPAALVTHLTTLSQELASSFK